MLPIRSRTDDGNRRRSSVPEPSGGEQSLPGMRSIGQKLSFVDVVHPGPREPWAGANDRCGGATHRLREEGAVSATARMANRPMEYYSKGNGCAALNATISSRLYRRV